MSTVRLDNDCFKREFPGLIYLESQVTHHSVIIRDKDRMYDFYKAIDRIPRPLSDFAESSDDLCSHVSYGFLHIEGGGDKNIPVSVPEMPVWDADADGKWLKTLQIQLTERCNERCVHCYIPGRKKDQSGTMSFDKVKDILDQFRAMNGLRIILSGGETLLHPDIMKIMEYCRQLDLMIFLHTNLLTLTEAQVDEIARLRLFNAQVSLYSDKADMHDAITRRKGSFERTRRGLELLARNNVPVTISCPIMRQNAGSVESLKKYADALGVDCYFDDIMMAQYDGNTGNLDVRIPKNEMSGLVERLIRLRPEYMQAIRDTDNVEELLNKKFARRMTACSIMTDGMCIDCDGSAYPCAGWNGYKLGDVFTDSLPDLWANSIADDLRRVRPAGFSKCKDCNLHNFCDMCPVYNYNENGDMTVPCPSFCERARITKSIVIKLWQQYHE